VSRIPFNRADIDARDRALLAEAIAGGHVSGNGPFTREAEARLGDRLSSGRVLLTTSCTHALEMAALLACVGPGDEVIVPAFTFVSTASAFMLAGATPVFVDVDRDTLNVDPALAEAAITPRTKAIVVVHYGGVACDMDTIGALVARRGLFLVEDNAHGLFATYRGRPLGTFGRLATQSFHETKNVTCGEGGALVVNDSTLAERAEILREKGTDRSRFLRGQVDKYTWVDVGSSWVLSDMLAAILCGQLARADAVTSRRLAIWNDYHTRLADWSARAGVRRPIVPDGCAHTGHVYHLRFARLEARQAFIAHLASRNVMAVFHYQPLHLSAVGRRLGGAPGQHPVTEEAGDCLVRLPLFASMTDGEVDRVIEAASSFVG
jgi:dTDP-4-amino-4,6-dideoxygalactose transaminase